MLKRLLPTIFMLFGILAPMAHASTYQVGDIAIIEDEGNYINSAVAMPNVFLLRATCAFYQVHADAFDAVFVFNSNQLDMISNTQQGWPVNSPSQGIGRGFADQSETFCSFNHRLRQAVKMGSIDTLPDNTDAPYTGILFYPLTGIELMAHEFGHQWLAAMDYDLGDGVGKRCDLRGYEPSSSGSDGTQTGNEDCAGYNSNDFNQHWSYYFNSGSLMYGSFIEELGGGQFRIYNGDYKYGHFDQYAMGLRLPKDVEPSFLIKKDDISGSASLPIYFDREATHEGEKQVITIDDVIRAMGPRDPALETCHWKAAFIIIHPPGFPPTQQQIDKVERYRQRWEEFYSWATDGRGSMDTSLDGCGTGTASCVGEVSEQCGAEDCSEGETRCNGNVTVAVCHDGAFQDVETCTNGDICQQGMCIATSDGDQNMTDGDTTDGDMAEDGDVIVDGDKPDGDWAAGDTDSDAIPITDGDQSIDGDIIIDGDSNSGQICTPGEHICDGEIYKKCSALGIAWLTEMDCVANNSTCDEEEGCIRGSSSGCNQPLSSPMATLLLLLLSMAAFGRSINKRKRG